jgi:hypothetical protein
MNSFISSLLNKGVLVKKTVKGSEVLVLSDKKSILITKPVQEQIKVKYPVSSEIGGVLSVKVLDDTNLVSTGVYFFDNTQTDPSKYSPNYTQYHKAISKIIAANELPVFFHTHPTKLGIKSYDSQRVKFYLTSSLPDRDVSFLPLTVDNDSVLLPSMIFVNDERFTGGLGVSMYGGYIFPLSFGRLNNTEITAAVLLSIITFLILLARKYDALKWLLVAGSIVVIYYLYHKPKYVSQSNGDILITV